MNFIFNDDFKIIDRFGSSCMSSVLWEINIYNAHAHNHMSTIVLVVFSYYSHDSNTDERRLSKLMMEIPKSFFFRSLKAARQVF